MTRKRILQTALKLVDTRGVQSLSIRKLAAELEVAPNSLYWYVQDKDDLLKGLVQMLFGRIGLPDLEPGPWTERLRNICRWYRARLLEHPNVVETASFGRFFPYAFVPLSNAVGRCLLLAGFEGEQLLRIAFAAYYHLVGFVTLEVARARFGFVPLDFVREQLPAITKGHDLLIGSGTKRLVRITSADVTKYLSLLRNQDMNSLFEYSLDCMISGLAAEIPNEARNRLDARSPAAAENADPVAPTFIGAGHQPAPRMSTNRKRGLKSRGYRTPISISPT